MQRPVMDPTFVDLTQPKKRRMRIWHWIVNTLVKIARWFGRSLMSNPLAVRKPEEPQDSIVKVLVRMAISWAIFLPALTALLAAGFVAVGTHPAPPAVLLDPNCQGCYFDSITFSSEDGTSLSGWMVPALDARRVINERDKILRSHRPGIVLVHDYGQSPQQMLSLVKPLHDEGMNVLVVSLRGSGSARVTGETFGLKEAGDVAAAVDVLRHTPFVDANRIAVAGIGSGANATMIAAAKDPTIKALIVANPLKSCDEAIIARIAPHDPWLDWMEPICRHAFELMYGVNADDLNYDRCSSVLKSKPSLLFDTGDAYAFANRDNIHQIREFCRAKLQTQDRPAIGSAR
jgi:hypothetical protein